MTDVLRIRRVYEGHPILALELHDVRLANGVERKLEVIRHPGAAAVVPLKDDGSVILLKQYRYVTGERELIEVPAGKLEAGEAPETCARRELEEETGWRAALLEPLLAIWMTPGFCDERIHLFLARGLSAGKLAHEEDELIKLFEVPLDRALAMIARGEITDAKTIAGLAAAALRVRGTL